MNKLMKAARGIALAALLVAPAVLWAQSSGEPAAAPEQAPLEASGEVAEQAAVTDTAAQREKKVCRTERITGSLTRRSRICLTEREWARMAEGTNRNVDQLTRDANQKQALNPGAGTAGSAY